MILELEDEELSVIGNEQNFLPDLVLLYDKYWKCDSKWLAKKKKKRKREKGKKKMQALFCDIIMLLWSLLYFWNNYYAGKKFVWFSYRYECYDIDNGFHTDMSVMKWTMVLELEDGELSVGCNEQNKTFIW